MPMHILSSVRSFELLSVSFILHEFVFCFRWNRAVTNLAHMSDRSKRPLETSASAHSMHDSHAAEGDNHMDFASGEYHVCERPQRRTIGDDVFFTALTDGFLNEEQRFWASDKRVVVKIIAANHLPRPAEGPYDVYARF